MGVIVALIVAVIFIASTAYGLKTKEYDKAEKMQNTAILIGVCGIILLAIVKANT